MGGPDTTPRFNIGAVPPPALPQTPTKDEKMWAMLMHLGGALGGITTYVHLPGGNFLVPLVIWLLKREGSAFITDQGKEVLNFQLCVLIVCLICLVTCLGIFLIPVVLVAAFIMAIIGAIKANEGVAYRYPINFRIIK
jgi:uncharacterized Tic20 family protein